MQTHQRRSQLPVGLPETTPVCRMDSQLPATAENGPVEVRAPPLKLKSLSNLKYVGITVYQCNCSYCTIQWHRDLQDKLTDHISEGRYSSSTGPFSAVTRSWESIRHTGVVSGSPTGSWDRRWWVCTTPGSRLKFSVIFKPKWFNIDGWVEILLRCGTRVDIRRSTRIRFAGRTPCTDHTFF